MRIAAYILIAVLAPALVFADIAPADRLWPQSGGEIPSLRLHIPHKSMRRLREIREEAMKVGVLIRPDKDEVAATLEARGKSYDVKIRLKGDMPDHWKGPDDWSLKVEMKGKARLWGMKRFSLMRPGRRGGVWEWLAVRAAADEGHPVLSYGFCRMAVNAGKERPWAIEEAPGKHWFTRRGEEEGAILKLDDKAYWQRRLEVGCVDRCFMTNADSWYSLEYEWATPKSVKKSGQQKMAQEQAEKLAAFREGRLPSSSLFDTRQVARRIALLDLLGATHALYPREHHWLARSGGGLRFISTDCVAGWGLPLPSGAVTRAHALKNQDGLPSFLAEFFKDAAAREAYREEVKRIGNLDYYQGLLERYWDRVKAVVGLVGGAPPDDREFFMKNGRQTTAALKRYLSGDDPKRPASPGAFSFELKAVDSREMVMRGSAGGTLKLEYAMLAGQRLEIKKLGEARWELQGNFPWGPSGPFDMDIHYRLEGQPGVKILLAPPGTPPREWQD